MSETDENYTFNLSYFSTSEKHSQNNKKKTFFFFQSLASYMELSREKKTEFAFFGTLELLLGQLSEDSSLPSEHCGMPSQTSYPAIQSPEPHVNCHTPQPENREEKMF